MRELLPRRPWLRALLHEMSLNRVRTGGSVHKALEDMTDEDAINLAKGISLIILSSTEPSAAVDQWIFQNGALQELGREFPWMRPFFVEMAQHNLMTGTLGLKLRVTGGALLSTIDLITDVYMTIVFLSTEGQEGYGRINACLIGTTLLFQIFAAYVQNSQRRSHFFKDALCIICGFKPALDAYRVGSGQDREEHQQMTPLQDMTVHKGIEAVFEAIPSSVLQIIALLLASEKKLDAIVSILVSAATLGFTSAMTNYDWDTSPTNRGSNPIFYGYIPDKAFERALCFISMITLSFSHVLLLTFSCALLAVIDFNWLLCYLAADVGLFFFYKVVTRDFFYFLNITGGVRVFGAILHRLSVKIIMSFTLMIHLRHPNEVGGISTASTLLLSLFGSFASAFLYSVHYTGPSKLSDSALFTSIITISVLWLISALTFFSSIKKPYLKTFYSTATSSSYNKSLFLSYTSTQDLEKSEILSYHPSVFSSWGPSTIKPWISKNWKKWEGEKPEWFNDTWVKGLPSEYIPFEFRVKHGKTERFKRSKSGNKVVSGEH
ncbi:hypothetical protein TrVE_jg6992 [Triparma verrucosa]|uniref:Uncharacterized protein n=1 Tax=Triparma verrucosa TaxID=1606542 RepID=A0A9W7ER64_9STRA|nr:hypothetical protein TrVE_jg6992 [Triparma verrucosa]